MEQSKKKRDRTQNIGTGIRLALVVGIIILTIAAVIGATVKLPQWRSSRAGRLAEKAETLTSPYEPENIKKAVRKYYEAILYSPKTAIFHIRLADLYLSLAQMPVREGDHGPEGCGRIAADAVGEAQKEQFWMCQFYGLAEFFDPDLKNPLDRNPDPSKSCLDLAKENYASAVGLDDRNIEALNGLASVCMKLGAATNDKNKNSYTLAKENFERIKVLDPNNIEALNGLGSVLKILGKHEAARANFEQALASLEKTAPAQNFISAYTGVVDTYTSDGKYLEAIKFYERFSDASVLNQMGSVYSKAGRDGDAIGYYEKARKLYICGKVKNPIFKASTYHGLGAVYTKQGRFDRAAIAYKRAAEIKPDDPIGENGLGTVWLGRNGFNKAGKHFDRALEIFMKLPDHRKAPMLEALVYVGKGYACQGIGDAQGSKAAFARAYEINGEAEEIFYRNNKIIFARDGFPLKRIRADGFKDFLPGNKGRKP